MQEQLFERMSVVEAIPKHFLAEIHGTGNPREICPKIFDSCLTMHWETNERSADCHDNIFISERLHFDIFFFNLENDVTWRLIKYTTNTIYIFGIENNGY